MTIVLDMATRRRKDLMEAIGDILNVEPIYKGAPTFEYDIDGYIIDRLGNLTIPDDRDSGEVEAVIELLYGLGILPRQYKPEVTKDVGLTISVPAEHVNILRLGRILDAKGDLIKHALCIDALPVEEGEDTVSFPWFPTMPGTREIEAYTHLISGLCELSVSVSHVNMYPHPVENEKYAFRSFLLRLGFVGEKYKTTRKILLQNLSGSAAFKNRAPENGGVTDGQENA